jgi:arogenate dehydrogenase (NADP+)
MKIGVVGLGLIGGSIFKAIEAIGSKYELVGVSSSVKKENVSTDYSILKDCDLVFVCSPMFAILEVLKKLEEFVSPTTIVTDVCSLKEFVTKEQYSYKFIPSHPMAGTEFSGWDNSFKELFKSAKWAITPTNNDFGKEIEVLKEVIKDLGADIIITTPKEHDKAVALISHAPMVIAQALCENIRENELAQALAASGFRDTTRLALSNNDMANDMVTLNKQNIREAIASMNTCLQDLLNNNNYKEKAVSISKFRNDLYGKSR